MDSWNSREAGGAAGRTEKPPRRGEGEAMGLAQGVQALGTKEPQGLSLLCSMRLKRIGLRERG